MTGNLFGEQSARGFGARRDVDGSHSSCGGVSALQSRWPHALVQCSHLHMGSLKTAGIDAAGVRDLWAALRVNTTLKTLE
jgi:hypothetical protein